MTGHPVEGIPPGGPPSSGRHPLHRVADKTKDRDMLYGLMLDILLTAAHADSPRAGRGPHERTPMKTKKELIRAYRENPPPAGIWSVRSVRSGRQLLGRRSTRADP